MPRRNRGPYLKFLKERSCYYIFWSEGGVTRKRSTSTADIRTAETHLADFIRGREIATRPSAPSAAEVYTIAAALDLYGTLHAPHVADPARIAYAMEPLLDFWGQKAVGQITKQLCREYAMWRPRSAGTVRRELTTLRAALNFAHSEGRLDRVPAIELPPSPPGKDRWLTTSEAAALLNAARTARADVRLYLPLFILIALYTGARAGAVLNLRWSQVDLASARISFRRTGERATAKRKVHGQPIPKRLLTFLRLAKRRGSDIGFVINIDGHRIKDIGGAWDGDDERRGHGSFGAACKKAGLQGVSPNTLRHTCGTWMAQRGVPLYLIGGWLGHSDTRTTELYAHHHPDHMQAALHALDRR